MKQTLAMMKSSTTLRKDHNVSSLKILPRHIEKPCIKSFGEKHNLIKLAKINPTPKEIKAEWNNSSCVEFSLINIAVQNAELKHIVENLNDLIQICIS